MAAWRGQPDAVEEVGHVADVDGAADGREQQRARDAEAEAGQRRAQAAHAVEQDGERRAGRRRCRPAGCRAERPGERVGEAVRAARRADRVRVRPGLRSSTGRKNRPDDAGDERGQRSPAPSLLDGDPAPAQSARGPAAPSPPPGRARPRRGRRAPCAAPPPRRRCRRRSGRRRAPRRASRAAPWACAPCRAGSPRRRRACFTPAPTISAATPADVRRRHRRPHEPQVVGLRGVAGDDGVLQDAVGLAVAVLVDARVAARRGDVDLRAPVRIEGRRSRRTGWPRPRSRPGSAPGS